MSLVGGSQIRATKCFEEALNFGSESNWNQTDMIFLKENTNTNTCLCLMWFDLFVVTNCQMFDIEYT